MRAARLPLVAVGLAVTASLLAACGSRTSAAAAAKPLPVKPGQTVVSLEFDDGTAAQWAARPLLAAHNLAATFYVISGAVGTPGYLDWAQIKALALDGHEIAGHTVTHPHLAALAPDEARREICDGRATLLRHGFRVTDFAYPYGSYAAETERIAAGCGYDSARTIDPAASAVEPVRPADPFAIRGAVLPVSNTDVSAIEHAVTEAETHGGGWLHVVFHRLCDDGCDRFSTRPETLAAFLDWLAPRAASGTVVRTVAQVLGGPLHPAVGAAPSSHTVGAANALPNPSLEADTDGDGVPDCWTEAGYGDGAATWARTTDSHTGSVALRLNVTSLASGDRKLLLAQDLGACSPAATPGTSYRVGAWYKATAPAILVAFYRDGDGRWQYWSESPPLAAAATWTQASWRTPPAPEHAEGVSVGVLLKSVGTLTVDDLSLTTDPA